MKKLFKGTCILIFIMFALVTVLNANINKPFSCNCCGQATCKCGVNCKVLSEQSLRNHGFSTKIFHSNFMQCNDCSSHRNKEETFLVNDSSSELKKKPALFVSQTILQKNEFVLSTNTAISIYDQHLLSSLSLFSLNECLRL
jgi:hypothetical protein